MLNGCLAPRSPSFLTEAEFPDEFQVPQVMGIDWKENMRSGPSESSRPLPTERGV